MAELTSIPKEDFAARLATVQTNLSQRGVDGLIAFSGYCEREGHVCYLTNHRISFPNVMSHMGLGHAAFVVSCEAPGILISPLGYSPEVVVGVGEAATGLDLVADLVKAVKEKGLVNKRIAIAGSDVVPAEYYLRLKRDLPDAKFEDGNNILESLRVVKSKAEVTLLRRAARIADTCIMAGIEAARRGVREYEVELVVREVALRAGADFLPRVRVSAGPRISGLKWPITSDKKLQDGDFVYLDVIGWFANYGFDNSRVKVVGEPSKEQRAFLDNVVEATEWMIETLKPGIEREYVHTSSRTNLITAFAHGIGLEICENPWLTTGRKTVLQPNMVLCVEPLVTSSEFGTLAIEDTVVVTEEGVEVLNQCPKVFW